MGLSCEERTRHVRHGPACVAAFLSCCHLSETLTREAREDQLILGTSEGGVAGGMGFGASMKGRGVPWNRSRGDLSHRKMGCPSEKPAGPTKGEMQRSPTHLCSLQRMKMRTLKTSSRRTCLCGPCSLKAGSGGHLLCQRVQRGRAPTPMLTSRPGPCMDQSVDVH